MIGHSNNIHAMYHDPYMQPYSVIKIVDVPDASVSNPQPITEAEKIFGEFLTPQKLREISGVTDLGDLTELKLKVDTTETSIGNIGSIAPNLKKLNLNNSYVTSVRDLGSSLSNLNTLWLSRCCIAELDGISCMAALQELYVAYNEIFDLSPLSMLENLEVLDLEGNNVDDITQVEFLSLCTRLSVLTLKGNPLEIAPTSNTRQLDLKFYSYKDAVLSCLPQLRLLDDESFLVEVIDGKKVKRVNHRSKSILYDADLKVIQDSIKAIEAENTSEQNNTESSTSRPISARRRYQSGKISTTQSQNNNFGRTNNLQQASEDHSSSLTHGWVMCGNPVQALRKRDKENKQKICVKFVHDKPNRNFQPEHSYMVDDGVKDKDDLLKELRHWRMENRGLFETTAATIKMSIRESSSPSSMDTSSSPTFSPTPPSKPKTKKTASSINRLSSRSPNHIENIRPHTAADFRSRRYGLKSPDLGTTLTTMSSIDEDFVSRSYEILNNNNNNNNQDDEGTKRPETRAALQLSSYINKLSPSGE